MVDTFVLIREVEQLLEQDRFSEVVEKIEPALSEIPLSDLKFSLIKLYLGQAKSGLGMLDQAESLFTELIDYYASQGWPSEISVVVKHELFVVLTKQGKTTEADSILKEILNLPDSPMLITQKASLLDKVGRKDEALDYLRKGLKVRKYDAVAMALMMNILRSKGDVTTRFLCLHCRAEFDIPVYYEDPSAPLQKASYIREKNRLVDSITLVTCKNCGKTTSLALFLCRNCYEDYAGEAIVRHGKGKDGKQIMSVISCHCPSCFDRNVIDTNDPQEVRFVEEMLKHLGMEGILQQFDNLVADIKKTKFPKSADDWVELARQSIKEGDREKADEAFCEAIRLAPHRVDIVDAYLKFSEEKDG